MSHALAAAPKAALSWRDDGLPLLAAVLLSAIFLISGFGKIAQPQQTIGYIAATGAPLPLAGYVLAVVVQLGGALALLVGFRARTAAAALAGFCIASALMFHSNFADQNQFIHFMKNVAMAGGFLQVAAFGRGRISLDGRRQ